MAIQFKEDNNFSEMVKLEYTVNSRRVKNTTSTITIVFQGGSSKAGGAEVEIIRYQVLIPVTEVQVKAGCVKEGDSHFLWELIHLRSQMHRRSEKIYQLSNR